MWGDGCDSGRDSKANVAEATQLLHHRVYLLGLGSLGVENRFGVIEEQDHLPRGQESLQRSQILGMFYPCTNGLGKLS